MRWKHRQKNTFTFRVSKIQWTRTNRRLKHSLSLSVSVGKLEGRAVHASHRLCSQIFIESSAHRASHQYRLALETLFVFAFLFATYTCLVGTSPSQDKYHSRLLCEPDVETSSRIPGRYEQLSLEEKSITYQWLQGRLAVLTLKLILFRWWWHSSDWLLLLYEHGGRFSDSRPCYNRYTYLCPRRSTSRSSSFHSSPFSSLPRSIVLYGPKKTHPSARRWINSAWFSIARCASLTRANLSHSALPRGRVFEKVKVTQTTLSWISSATATASTTTAAATTELTRRRIC